MNLPILLNFQAVLDRLKKEEGQWSSRLAYLENQIRHFEDQETPAYQNWLRMELGPKLQSLEVLYHEVQKQRFFAKAIVHLTDTQGLHPREALYVVLNRNTETEEAREEAKDTGKRSPEEVEARRRAKIESKRAQRKANKEEEKRAKREAKLDVAQSPAQSVSDAKNPLRDLYRILVRRLHPDSPDVIQSFTKERLTSIWNEVQSAYDERSLERLLAISSWLEANTQGEDAFVLSTSQMTLSERINRIRTIRSSCVRIEKKIQQLSAHPAWGFTLMNDAKTRRKLKQNALKDLDSEMRELQELLHEIEEFVESIGHPRKPKAR